MSSRSCWSRGETKSSTIPSGGENIVVTTSSKKEVMPIDLKTLKSVKKAFDVNKLAKRCRQSIEQIFESSGGQTWETDPKDIKNYQRYCFKDNGSNILAVAHCDVVLDKPHFTRAKLSDEDTYFNTKFDDRLGVYTILDLLPSLGINVDWVLTEDEESANSSGELFKSDKQYNWIVEFDRRGEDAVIYDYEEFKPIIEKYFYLGIGSFSDISVMEDLKACGVNIGVGYHNEHTSKCYMDVNQYIRNIARFINMFNAEKEVYYQHEPNPWKKSISYRSYSYGNNYSSYGYDEEAEMLELNKANREYYNKNYPKSTAPPMDFTCVACPECDVYFREMWIDEINGGCYCPECQKFWDWEDLEDFYDLEDDEDWVNRVEEKEVKDNTIEEEIDLNIIDVPPTPFGKHFKDYPRITQEERDMYDPKYIDGEAIRSGWTEVKESMNRSSDLGLMEVPNGLYD